MVWKSVTFHAFNIRLIGRTATANTTAATIAAPPTSPNNVVSE
jgi:hypothetical protein